MLPVTPEVRSTAEQPVTQAPCPYRARAWWDGRLVADSTAAVRVQEPGQPPALYFPVSDVQFDVFRDDGHRLTCPVKGGARLWSAPGDSTAANGEDVLWRFSEPAPELGWLAGFAAFDHDRVRVEVVDAAAGDAPRDVTVKHFPTWGDATDLIEILNVRPDGERHYLGIASADQGRAVVEGSQLLGQAIVAAGRHAPGRRVVSAHMVFHRAADAREPLALDLEELSSGRTFTALTAHASQGGRRRASGTLLLDVTAPDVIRHAAPAPAVPGPYDSEPYDMSVTGRDLRMVDAAYTDDPEAPVGPPVIDTWVRYRDVPADPSLHAALLAHFTGHISIAAALRPHAGIGQRQAHRTLSTGINAIGISFHADVRADRWMRYHHLSTFGGDGMTHSECRVYTEAEELIASFTVDAMVRGFAQPGASVNPNTAL